MTTLIAAYGSDGECMGRCDANCHNATGPDCNCICGGMNHGVGVQQAIQNTQEYTERWIANYAETHPDVQYFEVPAVQLMLPMFDEVRS